MDKFGLGLLPKEPSVFSCDVHSGISPSKPGTTGEGAKGRGTDDDQQRAQIHATNISEALREGEEEEVFSEARDTASTAPDKAVDDSDGKGSVSTLYSSASPPVVADPSAGSFGRGTGREPREKDENGEGEEEWCAGHVCLRLRPDGLRERRSRNGGGGGGARMERGGIDAGRGSRESSGSDAGSVSASDGEVCVCINRRVCAADRDEECFPKNTLGSSRMVDRRHSGTPSMTRLRRMRFCCHEQQPLCLGSFDACCVS